LGPKVPKHEVEKYMTKGEKEILFETGQVGEKEKGGWFKDKRCKKPLSTEKRLGKILPHRGGKKVGRLELTVGGGRRRIRQKRRNKRERRMGAVCLGEVRIR